MGQQLARQCGSRTDNHPAGSGHRGQGRGWGWRRFKTDSSGGATTGEATPSHSGELVSSQPPHSPAVSSVSMLANYDDDERADVLTEETSWETVQLADDDDENNADKSERAKFRHSSIKALTDKKSSKKQPGKRIRGNAVAWGNAPIPEQKQTTSSLQSLGENLAAAGNPGKLIGNTFRAGTLPAVITESKPMKDADRLLGVLTEHARVDSCLEEKGEEAGNSVRRLIQHDIGRERSVNTRLRELKDIDGRKSERRLSVTAFPSMSLNVIPEIVGEEPANPEEFKYSDMNVYF